MRCSNNRPTSSANMQNTDRLTASPPRFRPRPGHPARLGVEVVSGHGVPGRVGDGTMAIKEILFFRYCYT